MRGTVHVESAGSQRRHVVQSESDVRRSDQINLEQVAALAPRRIILSPKVEQNLQLEAVTALAQVHDASSVDLLIDLVSADWPSVRSAALAALARTDADTFISAISGLGPDDHWSVRASLAATLGTLPRERAQAPLTVGQL